MVLPAPGESVYVHLFQRRPDAPNVPSGSGHRAIPAERSAVKAYLYPREQGGWTGAYPDWFDVTSPEVAQRGNNDPEPAADDPANVPKPAPVVPTLRGVGLRLARLEIKREVVFQVAEVLPGSLAAKAGIETGDLVLAVNGKEPESDEQVNKLVGSGGAELKLSLMDVKKGQPVAVTIDLASLRSGTIPAEPEHHTRIIGVKVEPARVGKDEGVRVVRIMPDGPAQKAGLEVGDIITEVDGQATTTTAQLNEGVRRGGATLTLTVVDKNTGKKVPVKVAMAAEPDVASRPKSNSPATTPSTNAGSKTSLGVGVDFDIVEGTSGLKILRVQPDSLAQRAGLESGQVIIDANDTIALNQAQLDEIVKKSGPVLKLKMFDPSTRKKSVVEIKLPGS